MGVDEGLVPLGFSALLDRLSPPFTFITGTEIATQAMLVQRVAKRGFQKMLIVPED